MSVVIFLHGRGQGPETVKAVALAFRDARLLTPTGGIELRQGHTWFENVRTGVAKAESVQIAEMRLLCWIGEQRGLDEIWLCGFSNGGALAGHMLTHHPDRFRGAMLFAAPLVLPPWPAGALRGKNVFYAHGDATDTIVEPDFYESAEAYLTGPSKSKSTIRRYPVGHAITAEMIEEGRDWFLSQNAE